MKIINGVEYQCNEKVQYTRISEYGFKYWCNEKGQLHREDGPAIYHPDIISDWYLNGECYKTEWPDGNKKWYKNGGTCIKILYNKEIYYSPCKDCIVDVCCDRRSCDIYYKFISMTYVK